MTQQLEPFPTQATISALEAARVHVETIRQQPRFALTEAQCSTLYNVECILNSLQTEIEEYENDSQ